MTKRSGPKLVGSIFAGSWIDWNVRDGSGAAERYYCSAAVHDMTDMVYLVLHNEHKISHPRFIMPEMLGDVTFAVPQPAPPSDDELFSEDVPFYLASKPRGKAQ